MKFTYLTLACLFLANATISAREETPMLSSTEIESLSHEELMAYTATLVRSAQKKHPKKQASAQAVDAAEAEELSGAKLLLADMRQIAKVAFCVTALYNWHRFISPEIKKIGSTMNDKDDSLKTGEATVKVIENIFLKAFVLDVLGDEVKKLKSFAETYVGKAADYLDNAALAILI